MLEEEDTLVYEDLKRIMKELLFNGAKREVKAKFDLSDGTRLSVATREVTPFELLVHFEDDLPTKEFKSLKVILVIKMRSCFRVTKAITSV